MSTFKPLKFTVCYRKTIFSFITIKFSEEDFINQLSDENKNYWNSISYNQCDDPTFVNYFQCVLDP
jgi:hypothetical protein